MKREYFGKGILPRITYEDAGDHVIFYDAETKYKVNVPKILLKKLKLKEVF
jgi:hypothetical protein